MMGRQLPIAVQFWIDCRLCRRIAAYVLASVVIVEAVVLLPSVRNYERDLLRRLEHVGRLQVISAYRANAHGSPGDLALRGRLMLSPGGMTGGALYDGSGRRIGSFGEPPGEVQPGRPRRSADGLSYDVGWAPAETGLPFTVVGRLDAGWIPAEVTAFVWRILGLILLLSTVVWTTTMAIVGFTVLRPVLAVRASLARARTDPARADQYAIEVTSNDGLGDAIHDINSLYARVARTYREELSAFNAMAERAEYGIVAFDAQGGITYANPACLELCGCRCIGDLERNGMPRIDFGDGLGAVTIPMRLSSGAYSKEGELVGANGLLTSCIVSASRISEDEASPFYFYASLLDVSDLRAARDRLSEQNEALAAANLAKSEFLAHMSHELRTPLNAVIGFSEMMAAEVKGPLGSPVYQTYASDVLASGRHLLELVNEILDLARIDAGTMRLNEGEIDISRLLRSVTRSGEAIAAEKAIRVTCILPVRMPRVLADERRLRQVLLNLVGNAIKFGRDSGHVVVEARVVEQALILSVRDDGIGMNPADIPRALQPFTQLEGPLARQYEGAGLGLALARALTELHGGRLGIDSQPGVGTTATVSLPARRTMPAASQGHLTGA